MPVEHKLIRIEHPADPERCQSVGSDGQCPYKAMPGYKYCTRHGNTSIIAGQKQELRNYRLTQHQQRILEFGNSPDAKSLRDEIGILRLILENVLNRCIDPTDLLIQQQRISDLVMQVDKLVNSCHKLEMSMGMVLDKSVIMALGQAIIEIIASEVTDPETVAKIADKIFVAIQSATPRNKK